MLSQRRYQFLLKMVGLVIQRGKLPINALGKQVELPREVMLPISSLEAQCTKFVYGEGWGGLSLSPACTSQSPGHPSHSSGPLAPYGSPLLSTVMEAGEDPATADALASREPGFWMSSAPPVGTH